MYLGGCKWDYVGGHSRCQHRSDENAADGFVHDVRCWGWRTAWYNLRVRLFDWDSVALHNED